MRRLFIPLVLLAASPLAAQQPKPIDPANIDTTCAACTGFFAYANGGWLKRSSIPGDQPAWGAFNELQDQNFEALRQVLTEAAANARTTEDANLAKLGTFYGSCMDSTRIEAQSAKPLEPELGRIAAIRDRAGLVNAIAHLQSIGINAGFHFRANQDAKNSSRVIAEVYQGGLGLPDRDYYTRE